MFFINHYFVEFKNLRINFKVTTQVDVVSTFSCSVFWSWTLVITVRIMNIITLFIIHISNWFMLFFCSWRKTMISPIINLCATIPFFVFNLHRNCAMIFTKWIRSCFVWENIIILTFWFTNLKITFIKIIDIAITLSFINCWSKILPWSWTISSEDLIFFTKKKTEIVLCFFTL